MYILSPQRTSHQDHSRARFIQEESQKHSYRQKTYQDLTLGNLLPQAKPYSLVHRRIIEVENFIHTRQNLSIAQTNTELLFTVPVHARATNSPVCI